MKRFYRLVTRHPAAGMWEIHLDGKPVRTPGGRFLSVASPALADLIVQEWAAQGEQIVPDAMPVSQIVITSADRVGDHRAEMEGAILAYLDTDLLCYRAAHPEAVAQKQKAAWDPVLSWFSGFYGTALEMTDGLVALTQPPAARAAAARDIRAMDDLRFTLLQMVTALSGSLVLALAFLHRHADTRQVMDAAHVEEDHKKDIYNEGLHGFAPHEEKRRESVWRDLEAAERVLGALTAQV